jgi:hypothetical protein
MPQMCGSGLCTEQPHTVYNRYTGKTHMQKRQTADLGNVRLKQAPGSYLFTSLQVTRHQKQNEKCTTQPPDQNLLPDTGDKLGHPTLKEKHRWSMSPNRILITNVELTQRINKQRKWKNGVFWVVTPCGSCKNRRFGGTWHLLHQGDKNR